MNTTAYSVKIPLKSVIFHPVFVTNLWAILQTSPLFYWVSLTRTPQYRCRHSQGFKRDPWIGGRVSLLNFRDTVEQNVVCDVKNNDTSWPNLPFPCVFSVNFFQGLLAWSSNLAVFGFAVNEIVDNPGHTLSDMTLSRYRTSRLLDNQFQFKRCKKK